MVPVYATRTQMERLLLHTDAISELRKASDNPYVFTHELARYQSPLIADLARRITPVEPEAPAACILDTGIARAHPLIAPSLKADDVHAVDARWGTDDHKPNGHGRDGWRGTLR